MKIGELSKRTEVSVDTLRYYAKNGLLKYSKHNNYWDFEETQILRVQQIIMLRNIKFSIKEIYYVFHAGTEMLDGTSIIKEKVQQYQQFFIQKQKEVLKQKEQVEQANRKINKILSKLSYLENQREFEL